MNQTSAAVLPATTDRRPALSAVSGGTVAGLATLASVAVVVLAFTSEGVSEPGLRAGLALWVLIPYVGAGLLAWRRWSDSGLGRLMVTAGLTTFLAVLAWSDVPAVSTVGLLADFLPPVVFVHLFLAFPSGRLTSRAEQWLVLVAYLVSVGLSFVRMLLGAFGRANLLSLVDDPVWPAGLERAQLLAIAGIALVAVAVWAWRRHDRVRPLRRSRTVLVDSFVVALLMISGLFLDAAFNGPAFETFRRATFIVIGIAPVAFLVELGQARLARSGVGDLLVELGEDPPPRDLRDALAKALRDPTLSVLYWLPQFGSWADADGRPVDLPEPGGARASTIIDRRGVAVAALLHSPALRDEPQLVAAVSAAAGIALDNGRLQAELRARVDELAGSRARVIDAERKERQRLERDLHDGAQQRLVSLSLELGLLEEQLAADAVARARLDGARRTIALSLAELRDIARGIHPAVVSAHGLAVALEELTANAAVPVHLTVELVDRVAEPLEVAAYYLVCESLANIAKHANAACATVAVTREGDLLVVEVSDDGAGGADSERGTGLRGLADRVEGLGGRLRLWSPPGGGTRLRAELPCVS